ncbi:MAG: EI24 domain-containing protein [Chitinophagaceae bacterium]|nr:EI24 domain-containing protein [Chitinophagaceae bacterium]
MSFLNDLKVSIISYKRAIQFIKSHHLGRLILLSSCLYFFIAVLVGVLLWFASEDLLNMIKNLSVIKWLFSITHSFRWLEYIFRIGLYVAIFFFFLSIYKFLFLTLASPLYAYLSEKTASIIQHSSIPFSLSDFIHDMVRGMIISTQNCLKQLLFTLPLLLLSLIPIIGLFFSLLIILIDSYYYGFSMLDYNCERQRMSISQSKKLISSRKGLAVGNGLILYFSLTIPILGILIVAPLSVVAATLSFHDLKEHKP